jgi:iron complex transport system substrate-binding protein
MEQAKQLIPKRVASLLPAATETVAALGLTDCLVGVSHECAYPPEVARLPRLTRCTVPTEAMSSREIDQWVRSQLQEGKPLYVVDRELLARLKPDVILTQKLCDVCAVSPLEVHKALADVGGQAEVVELGAQSLSDVFSDMQLIAERLGVADRGRVLTNRLRQRLERLRARHTAATARPRAVVLEWLDPPFVSGHWIPELVELAGGVEVLGKRDEPAISTTWEVVEAADPDVLILACCGLSEERTAREALQSPVEAHLRRLRAYRTGRAWAVDAFGHFSCPGPRLVAAAELLEALIWPGTQPALERLPAIRLDPGLAAG